MRVLHIFGEMARGGAERRTTDLLPYLDPAVHPQHFATLSGAVGALGEEIAALGHQVHPCRLDRGFAPRFARLLRDLRPDVVQSHVHWASVPLLAEAAALGIPGRILHFRASSDLLPPSRRRRLRDRGLRLVAPAVVTRVLAVSEGAMDATWGHGWRSDPRCEVLYTGIEPTSFAHDVDRAAVRDELGVPRDAAVVAHVGNFAPGKNHARLGRVFGALAATRPHLWLVAVGQVKDPACEEALRREVAGAVDRLVLTGSRPDVPRLLAASDAFLFPSVSEGLPGSVLEARAAGLPVVASDLPGTLEIAARVSGVRCLSLEADDARWVEALDRALGTPRDRDALRGTPFLAETSAAAHVVAWEAAVQGRRARQRRP